MRRTPPPRSPDHCLFEVLAWKTRCPRSVPNPVPGDFVGILVDATKPIEEEIPRSFDGLRNFLASLESRYADGSLAEGIVFHHPDGRRAKIKRKDFSIGA